MLLAHWFVHNQLAMMAISNANPSMTLPVQYSTDSEGGRHPEQVRLVDLQMCGFGDLAYDLVYCLLTSTQRETRQNHLRQLLNW